MNDRNRAIGGSAIIILTTLVLSIVLAAVRKGPNAFESLSLAHMFMIFCLAGAVFYCVLKFRGTRELIFSIFIVTLLHLLAFKVTQPRYFLDFFLYYAALGLSVWIYSRHVVPRMRRAVIGKFVALAIIIVCVYSAATVLVSFFSHSGRSLSATMWIILSIHSLTGAAIGLGIEIGEMIDGRFFRPAGRAVRE